MQADIQQPVIDGWIASVLSGDQLNDDEQVQLEAGSLVLETKTEIQSGETQERV